MGAPYSFIMRKTEDVLEAVVNKKKAQLLTSVTIVKSFSDDALNVPRLEIEAFSATPEVIGSEVTGNWLVEVRLAVVSHYKSHTRAQHKKWTGAVEDIIMIDDMATIVNNLSTVNDFTLFSGPMGWMPLAGTDTTNGVEMRSERNARAYCAPSTL